MCENQQATEQCAVQSENPRQTKLSSLKDELDYYIRKIAKLQEQIKLYENNWVIKQFFDLE